MSDDPLMRWSREVTLLIQSLSMVFDHPSWQIGDLWLENATYGLIGSSDKAVMYDHVTN